MLKYNLKSNISVERFLKHPSFDLQSFHHGYSVGIKVSNFSIVSHFLVAGP